MDKNSPINALQQELEKKRKIYTKAYEQGEMMENLSKVPEWEFFEGFLLASKDELVRRVTGENFIRDHNGYLFTIGAIKTLDFILQSKEKFIRSKAIADKKLYEISKQRDMTE